MATKNMNPKKAEIEVAKVETRELSESERLWDDEDIIEQEDDLRGRKTGIARFFQLLGRDLGSFYKAGFLFLLGVLPGLAVIYFSVMAVSLIGCILGGILAGAAGGPLMAGLTDTILRSLREESTLWWHVYKKAWKQNWKQSMVPGIAFGVFFGIWSFIIMRLPDMTGVPTMVWITLILGIVFALIFVLYLFAQLVLVHVSMGQLLKNSGLFFLGFFPQSLAAGLVSAIYWALVFLYLPYSVLVLTLTTAWLPILISLMIIYPVINRVLHIEEQIDIRNESIYGGGM